jgi:hypothetical protein
MMVMKIKNERKKINEKIAKVEWKKKYVILIVLNGRLLF